MKSKVSKICVQCGNIYSTYIEARHSKFCSTKCGREFRKWSGISSGKKLVKCECGICKKLFYKEKNQITNNNYCSIKCANEGHKLGFGVNSGKNRVIYVCENCNKEFTDFWYEKRRFCSVGCWKEFSRKVYTCVICSNEFVDLKSKNRQVCSKTCQVKLRWRKSK